jgi:hypothetical protein
MRGKFLTLAMLMILAAAVFAMSSSINAQNRPGGRIWSGCELYHTLGTNTDFKPGHGPFDELYTGATFRDEIGAISESAPGDVGFNGGRWHVNELKAGVPADKYINACSVDDLDLNDFESTDTYFECPMLPRRGNN